MKYLQKIKPGLLLFIFMLIFGATAYSQCPQSGLKIQSKDCEEPKGLVVSAIGCTEMKIKWSGNKGQTYLVNSTSIDAAENIAEAKVSEIAYDNGNYTAKIAVTEGATINWNVQSICNINGAKVYSLPVKGPETFVPLCRKEKETAPVAKGFQVYPNPSKGSLIVEYTGNTENSIVLNVYDVNGKKAFTQNQKAVPNAGNQYKLDLHYLPPGAYMLEVVNGGETKQTRFVLLRE